MAPRSKRRKENKSEETGEVGKEKEETEDNRFVLDVLKKSVVFIAGAVSKPLAQKRAL